MLSFCEMWHVPPTRTKSDHLLQTGYIKPDQTVDLHYGNTGASDRKDSNNMDINASYIAASARRGATTSAGSTLHVVVAYVETPDSAGELLRLLKSAFAEQTAKLMTPMSMTDLFEPLTAH